MSITLGTMRSRMNVNLSEELSSGYWAASEKNTYLNMAYVMAAGDMCWKQTFTTLTLHQNKTLYQIPGDLLVPLRLRDTSGVGGLTTQIIPPGLVVELEIECPPWRILAPNAPLKHIYRSFDYLQIWPPPNNSYHLAQLTIEYVPIPPTLAKDTDVFDGPLGAAEAVIELANVFALAKYDADKAFARYNNQYLPRSEKIHADLDRDSIFKDLRWRVAGRFAKMHHSIGFRRMFPFGIHY